MRDIAAPQNPDSLLTPAPEIEGQRRLSLCPAPQPVFDTMETRFFDEGETMSENLPENMLADTSESTSEPAPAPDGWNEPTLIVRRRRHRGKIATWAALAAAALVACAILAFWRTRGNAEPIRPFARLPMVAPTATAPAQPIPSPAAPENLEPPSPEAAAGVLSIPSASYFEACKKAFDRRRAKDVVASCARAFAVDPDSPNSAGLAIMLAKSEFDRGRSRQALDWAKKAISLDQDQADAYVFLGGAEQAFGHAAAARAAYQRYLQLSPKGRYAAELRAVLAAL